ncbi:hypothetical protein TrCOL_g2833, partial [Triparma columacea]
MPSPQPPLTSGDIQAAPSSFPPPLSCGRPPPRILFPPPPSLWWSPVPSTSPCTLLPLPFPAVVILPELNEPNMSARPMLKADAVKFVSTFRNQFTVEKKSSVKDNLTRQLKFGKAELRPSLEGMFGGLFAIVENAELSENEYVMKATMRALAVIKVEAVAVTEMIIGKLTGILGRGVYKNP